MKNINFIMFLTLVLCFIQLGFFNYVQCKECTNSPTELSSKTVRFQLLTTTNETWRKEMFSQYHLIPTDDSTWAGLNARKVLREEEKLGWDLMYRRIKYNNGSSDMKANFLKEVPLQHVRLHPESIHGIAQQTNLEYLLMLDVDRLVWSFRKTAGLNTKGEPYGGWEAPDTELRGHFVGHYLSATAQMWAGTNNVTLGEKMKALVSALYECQEQIGTGYLSAFPTEFFDRFEAVKPVWAPYYTIHKIMAGLVDQYTLADNSQALRMVVRMADYFNNRVQNVISQYTIERHWRSLNEEVGGMNDVLYRLYSITGDQKHLVLAHLFDKPCFLGMLAVQADSLSGFHANTHIPLVIGSQMRYEITGDPLYKTIATYFMDVVNSSHCYATGGTSFHEFWSDPNRLASALDTENEESCVTYNMLKVSRNLFRWTKETTYADYYERALTNGVLGIQRGRDPGVMIYMLPLGRGNSKARSYHGWGSQNESFWCCYGTGIESFSKLGDSIYFEEGQDQLYIIQFVSSSFSWASGGIVINQTVEPVASWDNTLRVTFEISEGKGKSSTLYPRMPVWTDLTSAKAKLNDDVLPLPAPGKFLSVVRKWSKGDKLRLELPMSLRMETIKDERPEYASIKAILYGPYLLAGLSNGDWDLKVGKNAALSESITAVPASSNSQLFSLSQQSESGNFFLTNSKNSITMQNMAGSDSEPGSIHAPQATFRLVSKDADASHWTSGDDFIGKSVVIEPFDLPGMMIVQQGKNADLAIASTEGTKGSSMFRVVSGLVDEGTVSLESKTQKGCYIYSGAKNSSSASVKLSCQSESNDADFRRGTSFKLTKGLSEYHPISFVANGTKRNFLLMPLLSLRDEEYTVYFNVTV